MDPERRARLVDAALREFARGYHPASTDAIAEAAGISKGLIFHYFGTKKGLFSYLLLYSAEVMNAEYESVVLDSQDFIENVRAVSRVAVRFTAQQPLVYAFVTKARATLTEILPEGLPPGVPDSAGALLGRILTASDMTRFRDDIDPQKAQQILLWVTSGFAASLDRYGDDLDAYREHADEHLAELDEYFSILRALLYKNR